MEENHKPKVLMVHNYYQIPGGEDTVVANEKKLLEEHGHEVVLYTRHNNELKSMGKLQKSSLLFTTIFNPRTYREVKKTIREENIEIVHVHNTLNLVSPAVYYAAVKCGVPIVQTIHNFRFLCPAATFYRDGRICEDCVSKGLWCAVKYKCYRKNRIQTLICVIGTWIHRHTGILGKINYICLTDFNRRKLLLLEQIRPEKVFVKPNFAFDTMSEIQDKETYRKYYLFIGRIEEIKGVRMLVESFRKMPGRELRLAGRGPLEDELKGSDNIKFLGQIKHNELMKLVAEAKAIILPSQIYEGFPMTVPEAFSMHTPMIVGDIGNNGALIKDGYNGMKFRYNSAEALIQTIQRYENADRKKLGRNAYNDYRSNYSAESNYKLVNDIYEKICQ